MHSPKRLKITDVNPHLICVLCGGYYIDATTVIECLHSFCKSCIVKYLEKNKYCPICDVQIHKTTPLLNIRPDKTLQNIVYKLVPTLFKNEMQRRVDFYHKHPESLPPIPEQRGEITDNTPIIIPDEQLIVCLEYQESQPSQQQQVYKRYLHCPAALTISHLVKLIKGKFNLGPKHQVHIFFKEEPLMEHITLMDIAYTYQCQRKSPIHLTYKILELKTKRIRIINFEPKKETKEEKLPEKEWKEVQLQISENGVMSVRNVESCECSPIPAVEAPPVYSPSMSSSSLNNVTSSSTPPITVLPQTTTPTAQQPAVDSDVNMEPVTVTSNSQTLMSTEPIDSAAESHVTTNTPNSTPPSPLPQVDSVVSTPPAEPAVTSLCSTVRATPFPIVTSSASGPSPSASCPKPPTPAVSTTVTSPTSVSSQSVSISSKSIDSRISSSIPTAVVNTTSTVMQPSVSMIPHPSNTPTSSLSLGSYSVQTLSTSSSLSVPHLLMGSGLPHSPKGMEACTVTTMAGQKPSTNLVPSSFPIMSTSRPPTEPIVSVSKVSKDQVRKPNNVIEVNKLSISRVPPGGMKEKGDNLNKIVNKLSPNERVIGNTSVTIRPVTNSPNPPKMFPISKPSGHSNSPTSVGKEKPHQVKYKTLKSPTKQWNPSIDRTTMLMKQNTDQSKPSRFFKMRNMPRFLGNPASGVKPLYACPEESAPNQNKQKLTLMKVDPKSIPTSSIPRSPTKQPPPYTPGSPKMTKPPPSYPDPKPYHSPRIPSPAHAGTYLPANPYHLLYSGYPGFSPDANRMLSPELIRTMCAYHPSLPPSLGMLFNPGIHPMPRPPDGYKPEPTPAVQRIPPSKTETPPPKIEEKRFPSPVTPPDSKKISTPPPPSPKDSDKPPPLAQDRPPSPKVSSPANVEHLQPSSTPKVKENHVEEITTKINNDESNVVKMNCDDLKINNNNSKESPISQPECLATRPQ